MKFYFFILLLGFSNPAFAGDQLANVGITSCSPKICFQLNSKNAQISLIDQSTTTFTEGNLSFGPGSDSSVSAPEESVTFEEGYIDSKSQILVVKGVHTKKYQQILVFMQTGEIRYY